MSAKAWATWVLILMASLLVCGMCNLSALAALILK